MNKETLRSVSADAHLFWTLFSNSLLDQMMMRTWSASSSLSKKLSLDDLMSEVTGIKDRFTVSLPVFTFRQKSLINDSSRSFSSRTTLCSFTHIHPDIFKIHHQNYSEWSLHSADDLNSTCCSIKSNNNNNNNNNNVIM